MIVLEEDLFLTAVHRCIVAKNVNGILINP